jgi:hypothetical protein
MTRLRRIVAALTAPGRSFVDWQAEIPDEGRVVVVGLALLGLGSGLVWQPLGLIVPGSCLAAAGLGLSLKHPIVAAAAVVAVAAIAIAAILGVP